MPLSSPPPPSDASDPSAKIDQTISGNGNQAIAQMLGGIAIYQATINLSRNEVSQSPNADPQTPAKPASPTLGANPYRGLMAFQETDGDRFFGREAQIQQLWEKFRGLHEQADVIRILPIYGPSGSGKSSLARAGLIPELNRQPLPGYDRARVAVLVPGTHPLEDLATVLARVATNDPTPAQKSQEFEQVLRQAADGATYEGLRRIADMLPDITASPLIVLVDQFEEVYTLCTDKAEQDAFIENLLCAAAARSKRVSVIITLRSDFLGETQKHPALNALFAEQGFLVRSLKAAELRQAIAQPAEQAGHPLDPATIDLLIKDTEGREGALPLLQFALTRVWEGLAAGQLPAETLKAIGGVGGALAGEAQWIYDQLGAEEQAIARRVFLGLVQLGEGTKDTRRRVPINRLVPHRNSPEQVKRVIQRFADPGVRLITRSADGTSETVEVTHEALFEHWQQLQSWLDSGRSDVQFQRRLEEAVRYWEELDRPEGNLWRPPELDLLKQYQQRAGENMTPQQLEFFTVSQKAEDNRCQKELQQRQRQQQRQQQRRVLQGVLWGLIFGAIGFAGYQQQQIEVQRVRQLAEFSEGLLLTQPLNAETVAIAQINAIAAVNLSQSPLIRWTQDATAESAEQALLHTVQVAEARKVLVSQVDQVVAIAFSLDGEKIASGGTDHKVRLWDASMQQPIGNPFGKPLERHQKSVLSVAFSADGKRLVSGGVDRTIRVWDAQTEEPIGKPFIGHSYSVVSVAFSSDGKQIVSGSDDKTIRLWDAATGRQLMQMKGDPFQPILVGFSLDGKTVFSRSFDNVMWFWDAGTGALKSEQNTPLQTSSIAFTSGGKTIVSGNSVDLAHINSLLQTACEQLDTYSNLLKDKTEVTKEIKQTCDRTLWSKPQP